MFSALLDRTMDVMRRYTEDDSFGGQSDSLDRVHSGVPCRVNTLSFDAQAALMRSGIRAAHKVFCASSKDLKILNGDILIIEGKQYPVIGVRNWDEREHHLTILTEEYR
jgi:hypothetical protein